MKTARRPSALVRLFLVVVTTLMAVPSAEAHPVRSTAVFFDLAERIAEAELQLPLDQLGLALEQPLSERPSTLVAELGPELRAYVASHVAATARDGRPFAVAVRSMAVERIDDADSLVVHLSMQPPDGAPASAFTLSYNVILHRVVTHKIFVSIRRDFKNSVFSDKPVLAGVLRFQHESLTIDQSNGSLWRGFKSVFMLGMRHIAEGTDHLLFLLVLLLPAPLLAERGRWGASGPARRSAKEVLKIVTAFTVGHSITLVTAATGAVHVPSRPVEVLIAVSILVSAVHAWRPIFAGREPLIAGGFGLVHGLAFATILADFGLDSWALWSSVLGFNLGIEAMQILVVAMTMPWLVLLSRSSSYSLLRVGGALFGAVAACGWIAERALSLQNRVGPLVELLFARALYGVVILAVVSLFLAIRGRVGAPIRQPQPEPQPQK